MTVIPLTLVVSLCLTVTFIVFFVREHGRRRFSSTEHDSLMPLAAERTVVVDLGGRLPARRRTCGGNRHPGEGGPDRCGDCPNRAAHDQRR